MKTKSNAQHRVGINAPTRSTSHEAIMRHLVVQDGVRLSGGLTVANLVELTGYSESQVRTAIQHLVSRKRIYAVKTRHPAGRRFIYFKEPPFGVKK